MRRAQAIGLPICEIPLVKTAIAGEDANWGRIVMAVGSADQPIKRDMVAVRFGDLLRARDGMVRAEYDEAQVERAHEAAESGDHVDVGLGPGAATVWTCDLTERYIEINGDYRS